MESSKALHLLVPSLLYTALCPPRGKNPLQVDGLSKITLSGANRWHVSTHQQQKSLAVPNSQAADAQTPLTGTAAPSSASKALQGSAAAAATSTLPFFFRA